MSSDVAADLPLLPFQAGLGVGAGFLGPVALAVAEAALLGLLTLWTGPDPTAYLLPGVLLGFALSLALDSRDLRRWQVAHGVVLYRRTGARYWALTAGQASRQLVAVASR